MPKSSPTTFVIVTSRFAWASVLFLSAALFYAPLAYGCTRPDMLPPLWGLLIACIAAFALDLAFRKSGPPPFVLPLVCVSAILLQGWWMTWDPVFHNIQLTGEGLSDTTFENIRQLSFDSMVGTTLLLGGFLVACELFRNEQLRRFLLLAAALSGVLIVVIGLTLKIGDKPLMLHVWTQRDADWNDFAFYRYHGNAGAFLNLVWPLILVFARRAYSPTVHIAQRIFWTFAAVACGAALLANASKASLIIGLLILPWPFLTKLQSLPRKTVLLIVAMVVCLIGGALFASSHLTYEASFKRLTDPTEVSESFGGRMAAYQDYVDAVPDVGFFGLGPGLFQLAFPYQRNPLGNVAVGLREYAHEDYLQTILEWGWLGAIWWLVLIVGGLSQAYRSYRHRALFSSRTDRHLVLAAMLGVGGTLAQALLDFPLQVASLRLFFYLLLALCWASPALLSSPIASSHKRTSSRTAKVS